MVLYPSYCISSWSIRFVYGCRQCGFGVPQTECLHFCSFQSFQRQLNSRACPVARACLAQHAVCSGVGVTCICSLVSSFIWATTRGTTATLFFYQKRALPSTRYVCITCYVAPGILVNPPWRAMPNSLSSAARGTRYLPYNDFIIQAGNFEGAPALEIL